MPQHLLRHGIGLTLLFEQHLGLLIDSLDLGDEGGVLEEVLGDIGAQKLDYIFCILVALYHFLVVALDLVGGPGLDDLGKVGEHFHAFPLRMTLVGEQVHEIGQVGDIGVVLSNLPLVKLEGTFFLSN